MDELPDRWILPAAGHTVSRWCVGDTLTIELSNGDHAGAVIHIAGPFEFRAARRFWQRFWRPDTSHDALRFAPKKQSELKVKRAEAYKDGTLDMAFDDGSRLRVPPDAMFEAWEFTGPHEEKVIALPGGELAIWRTAA